LRVISGILAELQKKATFGYFAKVNLNPVGDKKLRLDI
jgi:hypothetical protein